MFDKPINRENSMMMISGLERMSEICKQAQRPSRIERIVRRFRTDGIPGVIRCANRKLRGFLNDGRLPGSERTKASNPVPDNDLKLESLDTASRKALYFSENRIAVYTVLFGAYDEVQIPLIQPDNIDYFIITDQKTPSGSWMPLSADNLLPREILGDPVLCNRWCKMHPHLLFPEHSLSIYVDANMLITSDLTPLTAALEEFPVSMFRHRERNCVYDEITTCVQHNLISVQAGKAQAQLLREHGVPKHWGLLEAPVIARRHHDELCISVMEEWWQIFSKEPAKRDQIALIDCLWKMNIPPEKTGVLGSNVLRCPMLIKFPHRSSKQ